MNNVFGIDLSKNHFGLCHTDVKNTIKFLYFYFKPSLKKANKDVNEKFVTILERNYSDKNFQFMKIQCKYDGINYNSIEIDSMKSAVILNQLKAYLNQYNDKLIILEDYFMGGTKIVQLVHVVESFKYFIAELSKSANIILFLCPSVTWKKYLINNLSKLENTYDRIFKAMEIEHLEVLQFIKSLNEKPDVIKELIDSYGLVNMHRYFDDFFIKKYFKRIFAF